MIYQILSFNGGGIRSVFSARILERLQREVDVLGRTDLLAGNSGGAIVIAALACGFTPEQTVNIFRSDGPTIFKRSTLDQIRSGFGLLRPKYGDFRKEVFAKHFGEKKLSDANLKVVITSYDLTGQKLGRWQPVAFHNFANSKTKGFSFVDCVMASSAANTYFPIYQIRDSKYSDGGTWANNPSMAAATEVKKRQNIKIKDMAILNIGTILQKQTLDTSSTRLGTLRWLKEGIIDVFLDGAAMDAITYYCQNLLSAAYHPLDILSDEIIALDDFKKIDHLIEIADGVDIKPTLSWLEGFWG